MAIKEMLPYRDEIIAMKEPPSVKTHDDVINHLSNSYGLKVSKPTITRFLRLHAPHLVNSRNLTTEEEKAVVPFEAFLRVEAEIIAMREELGIQIDTLTERTGGKMAVLSADIIELQKMIDQLPQNKTESTGSHEVSPQILRRIWMRAVALSTTLSTAIFLLLWFIMKD